MSIFRYIALCGALLSLPALAQADTALLTFGGQVLPGTCRMTVMPIDLDPISANDLRGGPAGLKEGSVAFSHCVGVTRARLSFDGTPADKDANRWANTAPDAATGITIALLAGTSGTTYLKNGDKDIAVQISSATDASYPLRAGYYRRTTGAISAGGASADIVITAAYD